MSANMWGQICKPSTVIHSFTSSTVKQIAVKILSKETLASPHAAPCVVGRLRGRIAGVRIVSASRTIASLGQNPKLANPTVLDKTESGPIRAGGESHHGKVLKGSGVFETETRLAA